MMILYVCQGFSVQRGTNERLLVERAKVKTLTQQSNICISVNFDQFDIIFPYNYSFAACLDEVSFYAHSE